MIIVLEGPDLAGKSTVAQNLMSYFEGQNKNVGIVKVSQPLPGEESVDLFTSYVNKIYETYQHTLESDHVVRIFDRLHVGEWVYGPRKRANSMLSWNQITAIDDMLDGIRATKVFVDQSDNELLKRYDKRGEDFVSKHELMDISNHYRQLLDPFSKAAHLSHEPSLHRWHRIRHVNDLGGLL